MKRNRIYLILLGVLAAFSLYLFLNRRSGTYAPSKHEFAVMDTGRVESVLISAAERRVSLFRTGGSWQVNGMPARKESIRGMQVLISRLEVEAPVSGSHDKRIRTGLEEEGTEVRIGIKDGRAKSYRVFFDSLSGSTFMMLEGSDIPFRVRVRGYRKTNLAELFATDPGYWRDNVIFYHLPKDIRSVFVRDNTNAGKSFHLARNEEGAFEVAPGIVPGSWTPVREERVRQYLGYFNNVRFDSFLDPSADTLQHFEDPDIILTLELMDGERTTLQLFPVYRINEMGDRQPEYDRLYARIDRGEEWVVLKYMEIDPLLKEFDYFAGL